MKKDKAIYLHIGTEKTGTTTIQNFLWDNREELIKQGFAYPDFLGVNHFDLVLYSANPKRSQDIQKMKRMDMFKYNKFQKQFPPFFIEKCRKLINFNSIILSSELLSSRIGTLKEIKKLNKLLSSVCNNIKVIIYLRRQDLLLTSLYSTLIKSGWSENFSTWVKNFNHINLNYYQLLNLWSSVFKKKNIIVKVFDKNKFKNNNLIEDFISIFPIYYNNKNYIENKNISLNVNTLIFLKIINKIYYLLRHERKTWHSSSLINTINSINQKYFKSKKIKMNKKMSNYINNKCRESNRLVAKEYLGLNKEDLF